MKLPTRTLSKWLLQIQTFQGKKILQRNFGRLLLKKQAYKKKSAFHKESESFCNLLYPVLYVLVFFDVSHHNLRDLHDSKLPNSTWDEMIDDGNVIMHKWNYCAEHKNIISAPVNKRIPNKSSKWAISKKNKIIKKDY